MDLRLYFLRHGETTYSREGTHCGSLDPELTAEGALMAAQFAAHYRTHPWSAAYVSPMRRTVATARPLCEAIGLEMHLRDGLRELEYGYWEGLTPAQAQERFPEDVVRWQADPGWNAPPGGESGLQVATRALTVLHEIVATHPTGNVLVVSHKATLRLLLCGLLGIDLGRYRDRLGAPAASVSVIHWTDHGPLLETLGDRAHLSDALRALPGT